MRRVFLCVMSLVFVAVAASASAQTPGQVERGMKAFGEQKCSMCHSIAGKGNADKAAVIAAVRERGFSPADDNEADAIAILLWAIETRGGTR